MNSGVNLVQSLGNEKNFAVPKFRNLSLFLGTKQQQLNIE